MKDISQIVLECANNLRYKFDWESVFGTDSFAENTVRNDLIQSNISLIQGYIERLEGKKIEIEKTPYFKTPIQDKIDEAHNEAIQQEIDYLKEQLELLTKDK